MKCPINETDECKHISSSRSPVGFEHKITVQASPCVDKRKTQRSESTTPPASPGVIPRLRAIRREWEHPKPESIPCERQCVYGVTVMLSDCSSVTPSDGSKTWGRSAVCKKEDLSTSKKKGRTWGPSSTLQKERVGGEEKYVKHEFMYLRFMSNLFYLIKSFIVYAVRYSLPKPDSKIRVWGNEFWICYSLFNLLSQEGPIGIQKLLFPESWERF